jgi:hypothetical protein
LHCFRRNTAKGQQQLTKKEGTMRRIKETLILCCAAAIVFCMLPNRCFAQTLKVRVNAKSFITVPVFQPKIIGSQLPTPEKLKQMAKKQKILTEPSIPIVLPPASVTYPKLSRQLAKEIIINKYRKLSPSSIECTPVPGETGVDGETILVSFGTAANVSTDEGDCYVTRPPNYDYHFDMNCGYRTVSYTLPGYYAAPFQQNVPPGTRYIDINASFASAASVKGIRGYLTNVPSGMDCIQVTLTQDGTCSPYVSTISVSKDSAFLINGITHSYAFSFENLNDTTPGVTYKIEVTNPITPTFSSCTNLSIPASNPPCILNCQQ